jgi:hypothetical protein
VSVATGTLFAATMGLPSKVAPKVMTLPPRPEPGVKEKVQTPGAWRTMEGAGE